MHWNSKIAQTFTSRATASYGGRFLIHTKTAKTYHAYTLSLFTRATPTIYLLSNCKIMLACARRKASKSQRFCFIYLFSVDLNALRGVWNERTEKTRFIDAINIQFIIFRNHKITALSGKRNE